MASDSKSLSIAYGVQRRNKAAKARGPVAKDLLDELDEGRPSSIAEAILRKKREVKIRDEDEGLVDLEANDEEGPSNLLGRLHEVHEETGEKAPVLKGNFKPVESVADKIRRKRKAAEE